MVIWKIIHKVSLLTFNDYYPYKRSYWSSIHQLSCHIELSSPPRHSYYWHKSWSILSDVTLGPWLSTNKCLTKKKHHRHISKFKHMNLESKMSYSHSHMQLFWYQRHKVYPQNHSIDVKANTDNTPIIIHKLWCLILHLNPPPLTIQYSQVNESLVIDLFQPKTSTFSTRALISVHFKTVRYFSQPIFRLFSYLKMHNTI